MSKPPTRYYQCPGCWFVAPLQRTEDGYECECGERMSIIDLRDAARASASTPDRVVTLPSQMSAEALDAGAYGEILPAARASRGGDMKPMGFHPVDLTELMNEGVLLAANERFFWPLGLALTWNYDKETGEASGLHLREWRYEDGHAEAIGSDEADPVYAERRGRFVAWLAARTSRMGDDEAVVAARASASTPEHRPVWDDDVPTGRCECGKAWPCAAARSSAPPALDVDRLVRALQFIEDTRLHGGYPHFGPEEGLVGVARQIESAYRTQP